MSSYDKRNRYLLSELFDSLESPFLDEELLSEQEDRWHVRPGVLEAESPFVRWFENQQSFLLASEQNVKEYEPGGSEERLWADEDGYAPGTVEQNPDGRFSDWHTRTRNEDEYGPRLEHDLDAEDNEFWSVKPKSGTGAERNEFIDNFEEEEVVDGEAYGDEEEELGDELDFEHLGILEYDSPTPSTSPTLGFEFDLNYGYEDKITGAKGLTPPAGFSWPSEGLKATDHEWKDSAGMISDAIVVTMDSVRLEIATMPFHIDSNTEFEAVVSNVRKFGQELIDAKKKYERDLDVPGVDGHPTTFKHPRTVVNKPEVDVHGNIKFPGDRDHASYKLVSVPLVIHRVSNRYPTRTELWASPQATITLPLAEFGKLVWEIHRTKGGAPGVAFTGRSSDRLGLRDDLAWLALTRAVADRKKKLGTTLSDGTTVGEADFTRSITSLVAILLMYMLTSIKKDVRDERREQFAKGSLPLNVKTPLWQIHRFALTEREKLVLHELYTDVGKRENLFELASGARSGNDARKLFPEYTHWDAERFLNASPTWSTLVDALVKEKQIIVTKQNAVPKKGHQKGNEILIAPLSSKIDWSNTEPRIAVEMRRLGFDAVGFAKWPGMMKKLRELARKVNP